MPTYTYQCKRCEHSQDVFHAMSATPRVKCEECGGPCKRLIGMGAGIIFKGSGFYETDYKNKGKAPASESSSSTAKSESTSEKKSSDSSTSTTSSGSESKDSVKAKAKAS